MAKAPKGKAAKGAKVKIANKQQNKTRKKKNVSKQTVSSKIKGKKSERPDVTRIEPKAKQKKKKASNSQNPFQVGAVHDDAAIELQATLEDDDIDMADTPFFSRDLNAIKPSRKEKLEDKKARSKEVQNGRGKHQHEASEEEEDGDDLDDDDDEEEDERIPAFERAPRRTFDERANSQKMPTKTLDGRLVAGEMVDRRRQLEEKQQAKLKAPADEKVSKQGREDVDDEEDDEDEDDIEMDEGEAKLVSDILGDDGQASDEDDEVYDSGDDQFDGEEEDEVEDETSYGASAVKKRARTGAEDGVVSTGKKQKLADARAAPLTAEELERRRQTRISRIKCSIAELAESILEGPEKHVNKLNHLHDLIKDDDITVQHLVMLSETEVFKDIIPGYRIRLPTAEEMKLKVSTEVQALRRFEAGLINAYKRFLDHLINITRSLYRFKGKKALKTIHPKTGVTAVKCLCRLLEHAYHFNYRKEIINAIVPLLNAPEPEVRQMCVKSMEHLFIADVAGDATLEAVKLISLVVKRKEAKVKAEVLDCLIALPLSEDVLTASVDKDKDMNKKPTKKEKKEKLKAKRKVDKELEMDLERDLQEAKAEYSPEHRKRVQTALLSELFTTYFRVLKQQMNAPTLPSVLKGLAKFAHLINLELVLDLLEYLKRLVSSDLSVESSLNCILAAFETLRSQKGVITIDLKEFYVRLYAVMLNLIHPGNYHCVPQLLRSLQLMFQYRKELSTDRVASFVKRLCSVALYLPPNAALAILHAVRGLMTAYPRTKQLLDTEATTSGTYQPELHDPDHSNAYASTAWEVSLLHRMFHPAACTYAEQLIKDVTPGAAIARASTYKLYETYDASQGVFNPPIPVPTGLSKKKAKQVKLTRKLAATTVPSPFLEELMNRPTLSSS